MEIMKAVDVTLIRETRGSLSIDNVLNSMSSEIKTDKIRLAILKLRKGIIADR